MLVNPLAVLGVCLFVCMSICGRLPVESRVPFIRAQLGILGNWQIVPPGCKVVEKLEALTSLRKFNQALTAYRISLCVALPFMKAQ